MKRVFTAFVLAAWFSTLFAEPAFEHLSFKGIPIDGPLNGFVQKMKRKGCTHVATNDGMAMLKGNFSTYENCCIVGVSAKDYKNVVCQVTVLFPECTTWYFLASNYYTLKDMLTEKYGNPSETVERFELSSQPNDELSKMAEVQQDRCEYLTTYETPVGDIQLAINHNEASCFVSLIYMDKVNGNLIKKEAMADL